MHELHQPFTTQHMDLQALKEELVPALLKYQQFREETPDAEWDALQDDPFSEMFLDALCEIENTLIQANLIT